MADQKSTDQKSISATSPSMETELGRLVVEQNLATSQEVEQCLSLRSTNGHATLAQTLVQQGVVTESQIKRLQRRLEEARKGTQIPGYFLMERLGSGAMATVFKAKQLSLDRIVAIKVLGKKLSENAEYVERFYKEGKAAARLNHANIVQAFDVGEANGYHYFIMEYVEGHTLYDELAGGKIFTEAEAIDVIIQIAKALEHAHDLGLIHRDVKPKNIMMAKSGVAKLADMGLARATNDLQTAQAEAGRAFGTPYYISPEQIRGEVNIDFRADIYSLGATFYHIVTGHVPFEGSTPAAVMHKHLKEPLIPPDHINTKLSTGLGEVVEVMMAKNRDRRYASTHDLLVDLQAIAAGAPPLMARKQINSEVLTGLADTAETAEALEETIDMSAMAPGNLKVYLLLMAAALAASFLLNIVLLFTR